MIAGLRNALRTGLANCRCLQRSRGIQAPQRSPELDCHSRGEDGERERFERLELAVPPHHVIICKLGCCRGSTVNTAKAVGMRGTGLLHPSGPSQHTQSAIIRTCTLPSYARSRENWPVCRDCIRPPGSGPASATKNGRCRKDWMKNENAALLHQ
jgi:hypothetical protein